MRRVCAVPVLLIAALLSACAPARLQPAPPPSPLERAVVTVDDVEQSIRDDQALSANSARLPGPGEAWFVTGDGCREVLVTAPHATHPTRDGALRFPDAGTGALTMALHRLAGVRAIWTSMASPSDPNYYDDNAFKSAVAAAIAARPPLVVLDLHASHAFRPYDVDFGTMDGRSLLGRDDLLVALSAAVAREGLLNQSREFFPAARNQTITKWVAARGVPAIQIEISATWLSPAAGRLEAHRYAQLLQALVRFVRSLGCVKQP